MNNGTLLGELYLGRRFAFGRWLRAAALTTVALSALCVCSSAEAARTRTRPVHAGHHETLVETHARAKSGGRRVAENGSRAGSKASSKAGAKSSGRNPRQGAKAGAGRAGTRGGARSADESRPSMKAMPRGSRSRRRAREEELPDPPLMYRVSHERFGRRGRMSMALMRRAAAREAMIAAAASPLRGSHDVLVHQNTMATGEGLDRIQTDSDLQRLRLSGDLIDFQESRSLHVNPELPFDRRSARVWTVQFAEDLSRQYYERFGEPLIVTSAARSIEYQRHLTHFNGNAAGVEGDAASPHLTGQAIDIGKRGMTRAQLTWMRDTLLPMMQAGKIDVEEEFRQACFHISVYPGYLPGVRELAKMPETPAASVPALGQTP